MITSKALLLTHLGVVKQDIDLASIAEVGSVTHAREYLQCNGVGFGCCDETLRLQLHVKDGGQLTVSKVLEEEARVNWEASGESRVDLLHHLLHLLLVSEKDHATVVAWNVLHLRHDGVDDGDFEDVFRIAQTVCFVDDKHFPTRVIKDAHGIGL